MLKEGQIVKIGRNSYEVKVVDVEEIMVSERLIVSMAIPCFLCDIKHCDQNRDLDIVKANNLAYNCTDLLPKLGYFKKVESSPQVDDKC